MSDELKPCPFCGGKTWRWWHGRKWEAKCIPKLGELIDGDGWRVSCYGCLAFVHGESREEAAEKWNTRAEVDKDDHVRLRAT